MKSPYVCISGVGSPKQEKPIARKFEESGLAELNRVVALGVEITPENICCEGESCCKDCCECQKEDTCSCEECDCCK